MPHVVVPLVYACFEYGALIVGLLGLLVANPIELLGILLQALCTIVVEVRWAKEKKKKSYIFLD